MKPFTSEKKERPEGGTSAGDASATSFSLPEKPLVTVEPTRPGASFRLGDLWSYRELGYFLVWRDLKVHYRQTFLGVAWAVLQPLSMAIAFTLLLGVLIRVDTGDVPYPLFVYSGLVVWSFFSGAVTYSSSSVVESSNLITKVYFPRLIVPVAAVGGRLVDLGISAVILVGMALFYGVSFGLNLLMVPVLVGLVTLLALGVGILASAINVKYRDVGVVMPVATQLWMYASPVIYPVTLIPEDWRWLYSLNPMVGVVENFRAALLGLPFDWPAFAISAVAATLLLVGAIYVFRRVEKGFADII